MKNRSYDPYIMEERITALENAGSTPAPTPEPSSWDYSIKETDTLQKWTDNKKIYCKVIVPGSTTALVKNNWTLFSLSNASEIDKLIDVKINYIDTVGTGNLGGNTNFLIQQVENGFSYYNTLATGNIDFVIIKYTKKTTSTKRSKK